MAGDWIQMDCDLLEKPEVQAIIDATGIDGATVIGRLFLFWRWVDRQAVTDVSQDSNIGILPGCQLPALLRVCGGDDAFWETVAKTGWLIVKPDGVCVPGFSKRFGQSAKHRIKNAQRQKDFRDRRKASGAIVTPKSRSRNGQPLSKRRERVQERRVQKRSLTRRVETTKRTFLFLERRGKSKRFGSREK